MDWVRTAEGAQIGEQAKNLILYLLAANKVNRLSRKALSCFLGDLGAHIAQPGSVELPKPVEFGRISFAAIEAEGSIYIQASTVDGGKLNVVHVEPYPGMVGERQDEAGTTWRFKVAE